MGYHGHEPDDREIIIRLEAERDRLLKKLRKVEAERDELQAKLEWAMGGDKG